MGSKLCKGKRERYDEEKYLSWIERVGFLPKMHEIETTPPFPPTTIPVTPQHLTSSPPSANIVQSANASLNAKVANTTLATPLRNHIKSLTKIAEQLQADTAILSRENADMKAILNARSERESDKRKILKGARCIMDDTVPKAIKIAEDVTKARKHSQSGREKKRKLRKARLCFRKSTK